MDTTDPNDQVPAFTDGEGRGSFIFAKLTRLEVSAGAEDIRKPAQAPVPETARRVPDRPARSPVQADSSSHASEAAGPAEGNLLFGVGEDSQAEPPSQAAASHSQNNNNNNNNNNNKDEDLLGGEDDLLAVGKEAAATTSTPSQPHQDPFANGNHDLYKTANNSNNSGSQNSGNAYSAGGYAGGGGNNGFSMGAGYANNNSNANNVNGRQGNRATSMSGGNLGGAFEGLDIMQGVGGRSNNSRNKSNSNTRGSMGW